ncbi:MAG: hypothetical protein JNL90_09930 [Planctomycetes bacterium]|nr:hypothetical protein [Planctomycetota bacterium]
MPLHRSHALVLPFSLLAATAIAQQPATPPAAPNAPAVARAWTLLIYGATDNDAEGDFLRFLNDLRAAIADDPALELVTFVDRHAAHSNDAATFGEDFTGGRLYRMHATSAERLAGGDEFPACALDAEFEPDSADPETLRQFLAFGQARFPAPRTALLIYGHASGVSLCPDEQSRRSIGIPELAQAVGNGHSVDWVALELCNMGGAEIAYQWSAFADGFATEVLTAIPNAGPPLDWRRIFERVHSPSHAASAGRADTLDPATMSAIDFGRLVVEEGGKGRLARAARSPQAAERLAHEAVASYQLDRIGAVKRAVDAFAVALAADDADGKSRRALEALRDGGDGQPSVMNYSAGRFDDGFAFVDLAALLERAAPCESLGVAARAAARAALAAVDDCVVDSFGMPGYAGFTAGRHGMFLHFPDGDAPAPRLGGGRSWSRSCWYSPRPAKDHEANVGEWAWCRDGAIEGDGAVQNWFELLDRWYDVADANGGLNGWRV